MNDAQHAAYQAYLRDLADRLLLRDWEIKLDRERPRDATAYAEVYVSEWENAAVVSIDFPGFFAYPAEKRREVLTHELVHLHMDRPHRVMAQLGGQFEDNTATQFAKEAHRKEIEVCTQRFARILAPLLPLPPEVEP